MARPLRIEYPGAYYHVMNRGLSHGDIFLEYKEAESCMRFLAVIAVQSKVDMFAYCLMNNHYHLLLSTAAVGLSRAMRHLEVGRAAGRERGEISGGAVSLKKKKRIPISDR